MTCLRMIVGFSTMQGRRLLRACQRSRFCSEQVTSAVPLVLSTQKPHSRAAPTTLIHRHQTICQKLFSFNFFVIHIKLTGCIKYQTWYYYNQKFLNKMPKIIMDWSQLNNKLLNTSHFDMTNTCNNTSLLCTFYPKIVAKERAIQQKNKLLNLVYLMGI